MSYIDNLSPSEIASLKSYRIYNDNQQTDMDYATEQNLFQKITLLTELETLNFGLT